MEIESKVLNRLRMRGFSEDILLNNRGLIGAVIEDTIIETVTAQSKSRPTDRNFPFSHETKNHG